MNIVKKLSVLSFTLVFIASGFCLNFVHPPKAEALANSDFNASRIIDDSVFFNPNSMSSQDIQNFLVSKVPTCETWHSQDGYPYPPPYICLRDYVTSFDTMPADAFCSGVTGGTKSAATIIKEVSAACNVNPQILLVLLQKEQILITDTWPLPTQYTKATGFGCPDSDLGSDVDANNNNCYDEYEGFFKQMYYGARQYQKYAKQPQFFNFRAGQTANISYNPNAGCGSSSVTIQNQATAGLYNYTPYQPNAAVLNSPHGTVVTCGAYGNINFWWQFWNWFGNPIGSPYAWLIENYSYSGGDNILTKGYAETITLKAKNVGRLPWYRGGDNPVRLGTWQAPDHPSPLLNGGIRYATLAESVVQPNDVGTFTFTVTPSTSGTFVEAMNLVVENSQWMSWPGFSPTVVVASTPFQYNVENIIYGNGSGVMEPGQVQDMTMIVRNTGNITWSKSSGPPIMLAPWGHDSEVAVPEPGKWESASRITLMNESSVAPGQTAGFQFKVRVPRAGNFYEQLSIVAEGHSWFDGNKPTLYLRGASYAWQPVWTSISTGNVNIGRSQTFDITIRAKNTGELPWRRNGGTPIRLATTRPQDRGSALYFTSWLRDNRPSSLVESVVMPGGEGTFTFTARTPNTPGGRTENFSLVAEGVTWFNDPGLSVFINTL